MTEQRKNMTTKMTTEEKLARRAILRARREAYEARRAEARAAVWSFDEAALHWGVSRRNVKRWFSAGRLQTARLGRERHWLVAGQPKPIIPQS